MARVVVMGAGLGGVACAYEMTKKLGKSHEVTVVGSSAFFEFTPSNPWIMVGWRMAPQTRDRVPMTYVTTEPYIGHMGLGGVGDSKGLMESVLRQRHIHWITNAKITGVEAGVMTVAEHAEDGSVKKEHKLPFRYSMVIPAFKDVDAVAAVPELCNPRGFVLIDEHQRSRKYPNIYSAGVCVAIPPVEATPVPAGEGARHLERHLPRRLRRHGRGVRRAAADPAAQRHLGQGGQVGAPGQGRLREVLPAQGADGRRGAAVREVLAEHARHRVTQVVSRS